MLVEICAHTYHSAINAEAGGAHRIELCEELAFGGLSPSRTLIRKVLQELSIPVYVLIRPRGGDFPYSKNEFELMKADIIFCKEVGCGGIVSGILNSDNTVDLRRTSELIQLAKPMTFTFHRAFDETPDPHKALQDLINIGAQRILTSGQKRTAIEGLPLLKELKEIAKNKMHILVGGNVRSTNVLSFKNAGFQEIHSSALLNSDTDSNLEEIKKMVALVKV